MEIKMQSIETFEKHALEYDAWYEKHRPAYESELLALKELLPEYLKPEKRKPECLRPESSKPEKLKSPKKLEIGVGTGRFAAPLGIGFGLEPAKSMAQIAKKSGIEVCLGIAENLPFKSETFDLLLFVIVLCMLENPRKALLEAHRVTKPEGRVLIAIIDKNSPLGQRYEAKKEASRYYKYANFLSAKEVIDWLSELGYEDFETCQTIFKSPESIEEIEEIKSGTGEGLFAVISARKGII